MGSCCFTPKKTHFLWWYWLALASVVGIPLIVATRYVQKRKEAGGADLAQIGHEAGAKFWRWMIMMTILAAVGGGWLAQWLMPQVANALENRSLADKYDMTIYILTLDFFCCYVLAYWGVKLARRWDSAEKQMLAVMTFFGIWLLVFRFTFLVNPLHFLFEFIVMFEDPRFMGPFGDFYPLSAALMFAACLPMAAYWFRFIDMPEQKTAQRALVAFIVCPFFFYAAMRYGPVAHFYIFNLIRGSIPPLAEAIPYMMK